MYILCKCGVKVQNLEISEIANSKWAYSGHEEKVKNKIMEAHERAIKPPKKWSKIFSHASKKPKIAKIELK